MGYGANPVTIDEASRVALEISKKCWRVWVTDAASNRRTWESDEERKHREDLEARLPVVDLDEAVKLANSLYSVSPRDSRDTELLKATSQCLHDLVAQVRGLKTKLEQI